MAKEHWLARAEMVVVDHSYGLLGEDEDGRLYAERNGRWVPFRAWNPLCWPAWLRSRRHMLLVMLESAPEGA